MQLFKQMHSTKQRFLYALWPPTHTAHPISILLLKVMFLFFNSLLVNYYMALYSLGKVRKEISSNYRNLIWVLWILSNGHEFNNQPVLWHFNSKINPKATFKVENAKTPESNRKKIWLVTKMTHSDFSIQHRVDYTKSTFIDSQDNTNYLPWAPKHNSI